MCLIRILVITLIASGLFILQTGCIKGDVDDDTYFDSKVIILGHKGMGNSYMYPGNTYESVMPALGIGVDGCELDVQLTSDTVLVLFHDASLDELTNCSGKIYEHSWEEIRNCSYSLSDGINIYSADGLFGSIPNLQQYYFSFDCKLDYSQPDYEVYSQQFIRAMNRLFAKYNMYGKVFLEGPKEFLQDARDAGLTNRMFATLPSDYPLIGTAIDYALAGICTDLTKIEDLVDEAHAKQLLVMTYSPDNMRENLKALKLNVDIIQTDDPMSILKFLERYNYEYIVP